MVEGLRRRAVADVDRASAAAALEAVFAEYLVPISWAEPAYALHVDANDVDAAASPIWYDANGTVVAAALLAIRGTRGWIGGFGVAPAHRRQRLGHALLADVLARARSLGLVSVGLEVLAENEAARRTYEAGGFRLLRRLATFATDARHVPPGPTDAPYTPVGPLLAIEDAAQPCWQRERESLGRQPNLHAVGDAGAFCVFRHNGERAQLLKARAASAEQFARLAAGIVAQSGVARLELFNEPAESANARAARSLGWSQAHEVDEMLWTAR